MERAKADRGCKPDGRLTGKTDDRPKNGAGRATPRESDGRSFKNKLATMPTQRATAIRPSKTDRAPAGKWRRKDTPGDQEHESGAL